MTIIHSGDHYDDRNLALDPGELLSIHTVSYALESEGFEPIQAETIALRVFDALEANV